MNPNPSPSSGSCRSLSRAPVGLLATLALGLFAAAPIAAQDPVPLTLQDTLRTRFSPRVVSASFVDDLVRLRFPNGDRWFDPAKKDFVEREPGAATSPASGRRTRSSARPTIRPIPGVVQPAGYRVGDVVIGRGKDALPATAGGGCREPHIAPDGEQISFVRGGDLHITAKLGAPAWQVTDDGGPQVLNGALDWVYQEEVYGRGNFQAHWWSPNSEHVAFLTIDSRAVKPFTVIDHAPTRTLGDERSVRTEVTLYPKAGDPNPTASLSIASPGSREVVEVDLGSRYDAGFLVVRVGWRPDSSEAFVQVTNRVQNWLELLAVNPTDGSVRRVLREESDTWVEILGQPRWLEDGSFLWQTERRGTKDYDRYTADGKRVAEVVKTDFDALSIVRIDEDKGLLWFVGRGQSPIDRHLFRVGLDGKRLLQLTTGPGTHSTTLAKDGSLFLDTVSSSTERPETRVCDAVGGVLLRVPSFEGSAAKRHGLAEKQAFVIEARDGYPLDVTAIVPEGQGPFPIFLDTYSGPDAPSVRNRWSHSAWHQFLVQQGILVLQCNVRTASGRGHQATSLCYEQLGVYELKDLEDAVAFACRELGGDPEHVGIRGWSYGGFMSAYALTHSDKFALGLAGAGVHDWQLYDTIYTERYMNTPQANPDGYANTSVVNSAKDLKGHLVILHGTKDDNVHLQNSIRLVDELQRAGKDSFEFMVYPGSRHGVRSAAQRAHMRRLEWRAIQTHLLGR